jgi:hypothetical protein
VFLYCNHQVHRDFVTTLSLPTREHTVVLRTDTRSRVPHPTPTPRSKASSGTLNVSITFNYLCHHVLWRHFREVKLFFFYFDVHGSVHLGSIYVQPEIDRAKSVSVSKTVLAPMDYIPKPYTVHSYGYTLQLCSWGWVQIAPETCRANNKEEYGIFWKLILHAQYSIKFCHRMFSNRPQKGPSSNCSSNWLRAILSFVSRHPKLSFAITPAPFRITESVSRRTEVTTEHQFNHSKDGVTTFPRNVRTGVSNLRHACQAWHAERFQWHAEWNEVQ